MGTQFCTLCCKLWAHNSGDQNQGKTFEVRESITNPALPIPPSAFPFLGPIPPFGADTSQCWKLFLACHFVIFIFGEEHLSPSFALH